MGFVLGYTLGALLPGFLGGFARYAIAGPGTGTKPGFPMGSLNPVLYLPLAKEETGQGWDEA